MNSIIEKAKAFAEKAHGAHRRKYTGEPYTVHLQNVAQILDEHGQHPDIVAAAWLHDTLEDTDTTLVDLDRHFGPWISELVMEVTDISRPADGNRRMRKRMDLEHLAKSGVPGASLKLADLIDNARSIVEADPAFAAVYLREKAELLEVLGHGAPTLMALARKTLADAQAKLAEFAE